MQTAPSRPHAAATSATPSTRFIAGPPGDCASRPNQPAMVSDCAWNQGANQSLHLSLPVLDAADAVAPLCSPITRSSGSISTNGALVNSASSTPKTIAAATSGLCARIAAQRRRSSVRRSVVGASAAVTPRILRDANPGCPDRRSRPAPVLLDLQARDDVVRPLGEAVVEVVLGHQLALARHLDVELALRWRTRVDARDEPPVGALDRAVGLADCGVVEQERRDRVAVEQLG